MALSLRRIVLSSPQACLRRSRVVVRPLTTVATINPDKPQPTVVVAEAKPTDPTPPSSSSSSSSSSDSEPVRAKLGAFLAGAALTGLVGYYRLHTDLWESAKAVSQQVNHLGNDIAAENKSLAARLSKLEARVDELAAANAAFPATIVALEADDAGARKEP